MSHILPLSLPHNLLCRLYTRARSRAANSRREYTPRFARELCPSTLAKFHSLVRDFNEDGRRRDFCCCCVTAKKTFSIVLLALVDSNYNFIFADIGCQGRISDGGVFRNSSLWKKICRNELNLPTPRP